MFGFEKKITVVMKVNGMHCHKCAERVSKALSAVVGVTKVKIDLEGKTATLFTTDKFDLAAANKAVTDAGFEVEA